MKVWGGECLGGERLTIKKPDSRGAPNDLLFDIFDIFYIFDIFDIFNIFDISDLFHIFDI